MTDEDFGRLLAALAVLSPTQLVALERAIAAHRSTSTAGASSSSEAPPPSAALEPTIATPPPPASIADIEARFAAAPVCPHCQAREVGKWGTANRLRRYRCNACKATFNALTGTPLAHLHKRELWGAHAQALIDGISLRKVVARLDVHMTTAFRWRHRFLKAPKMMKAKELQGTVEADETYFLYSEKGSRKLTRPPRRRGGKAKKRGLSDEQVPVLIARDRSAATTDQVLPDRSAASIGAVLEPVVAKSAILVSDGAQAYRSFANRAAIVHVALNLSAGERTWGIYHVQNVNGYASRLKGWMGRFNGVATKYLDSYLGWHRTNEREGCNLTASRMLAAACG